MAQKAVARVGDTGIGVCTNHGTPQIYTTTFTSGSALVKVGGKLVCTVGTVGTSTCGHQTTAMTGGINKAGGAPIHRVGDTGQNYGQYTVNTGSPSVTSE